MGDLPHDYRFRHHHFADHGEAAGFSQNQHGHIHTDLHDQLVQGLVDARLGEVAGKIGIGIADGQDMHRNGEAFAGKENIFIFGLTADEVSEIWRNGYSASVYYNSDPMLRKVIEALIVGFNGESFADIANYLHISQRTYSRYENDERAIPIEIISSLADYHHTSVDYLIGRTDNPIPYP